MRVVCIDDSDQPQQDVPHVTKGNIYNVVGEDYHQPTESEGYKHKSGVYYILAECGNSFAYHSSMFITINEIQIDETEFERNYNKELA